VIWFGPQESLVTSAEQDGENLEKRLRAVISEHGGAAVDVSAQRTTVRLRGAHARSLGQRLLAGSVPVGVRCGCRRTDRARIGSRSADPVGRQGNRLPDAGAVIVGLLPGRVADRRRERIRSRAVTQARQRSAGGGAGSTVASSVRPLMVKIDIRSGWATT
jgi:hypothetical protein